MLLAVNVSYQAANILMKGNSGSSVLVAANVGYRVAKRVDEGRLGVRSRRCPHQLECPLLNIRSRSCQSAVGPPFCLDLLFLEWPMKAEEKHDGLLSI